MPGLGFIGAGTVGTALAILLGGKGYPVVAVSSRSPASAQQVAKRVPGCRALPGGQEVAAAADLVFITTPDNAIGQVASEVHWRPENSVVHCSGAHSLDILEPARKAGAAVGSIHPLQAFAGPEQAIANLPGATFALEAGEPLLSTLQGIALALEGSFIKLKGGDKAAYHAAAVMASNYLVTLVKTATDLWQTFCVPPDKAAAALLPLIRGTLNNIEALGIPRCLTGPISRGDTGTVRQHLETLRRVAPSLLAAYRELGLQTIPIALAKGKIDSQQADELDAILRQAG